MKSMTFLKKISSSLCILLLMMTAATAQSRYKHVPRVKVDASRTNKVVVKQDNKQLATPITTIENPSNEVLSSKVETSMEETSVATVSSEATIIPITHKTKTVKWFKKSVKPSKKVDKEWFTDQAKSNSKLLDVKENTKTNAAIALILLIAFYILAFIFILIAVLMLLGVIGGYSLGAFLAILIIGIVFALAASVLLTLIKVGLV